MAPQQGMSIGPLNMSSWHCLGDLCLGDLSQDEKSRVMGRERCAAES